MHPEISTRPCESLLSATSVELPCPAVDGGGDHPGRVLDTDYFLSSESALRLWRYFFRKCSHRISEGHPLLFQPVIEDRQGGEGLLGAGELDGGALCKSILIAQSALNLGLQLQQRERGIAAQV